MVVQGSPKPLAGVRFPPGLLVGKPPPRGVQRQDILGSTMQLFVNQVQVREECGGYGAPLSAISIDEAFFRLNRSF